LASPAGARPAQRRPDPENQPSRGSKKAGGTRKMERVETWVKERKLK